MPYRPIIIANEFLRTHGSDGNIDHLKLQKLSYFTQGWWLALRGQPLLTERPQVWRYGPVFKSLYGAFVGTGDSHITELRRSPFGNPTPTLEGNEHTESREFVAWIWDQYGHLSGTALSDLTHAPGTPWRIIAERENFKVPMNLEIKANEDWTYFAELARARGLNPVELAA